MDGICDAWDFGWMDLQSNGLELEWLKLAEEKRNIDKIERTHREGGGGGGRGGGGGKTKGKKK